MRLGSGRMPSSSSIEAIPIGKIALERGAETGSAIRISVRKLARAASRATSTRIRPSPMR
jgi:hypothetical protein